MRPLRAAALILLSSVVTTTASARTTEEYRYDFSQTWRSAVRLIAVDLRYSVTERDAEIGYVLFEYESGGRRYPGSLELVRTEGVHETPQVRVVISVHDQPSYIERIIIDRLSRKLSEDYGSPPPSRRPVAPPPEDSEDDDDDESDDEED